MMRSPSALARRLLDTDRGSSDRRPGIRGDVQGLRAIAVLTVVADHYGVPFLRGGYFGVDVFFVISGYLITLLLLRESRRRGRFSLREFYSRRARRILPAATLVTLATVVLASAWVSATQMLRIVTDAVWATLFVANVHFAQQRTDYNLQGFSTSPLQHYWSLAVEEQFYVVWPLLMLACLLLARRLRGSRRRYVERAGTLWPASGDASEVEAPLPRWLLLSVLVALAAGSFGYAAWRMAADPTATYFSTPARIWELAVGALTALLGAKAVARVPRWMRGVLTAFGVAAIVVACVVFDATTQTSAVSSLVPVLGTAAVLAAGAAPLDGEARPVWPRRLLSIGPLRLVGDWSYSLYLWHWPLLILAQDHSGRLAAGQRWELAGVALVLAGLTYRYVETPFRDRVRFPRPRALAFYPASVVLVAVTCGAGTVWAHYRAGEFGHNPAISLTNFGVADPASYHFPRNEQQALVHASVIAAQHHMAVPSHLQPRATDLTGDVPSLGDCEYGDPGNRNLCPRGDTSADRTIVVFGNSHGRMWIPAIERIADRAHYTTYYLTKQNCSAIDLNFADVDPNTPMGVWEDCSDWRQWAFSQIERLHPAITIVSTTGPNPVVFTPRGFKVGPDSPGRDDIVRNGFTQTLRRLRPYTDRTVLLRDVPKPGFDPGTCLTTPGHDLGDCLFTPVARAKQDSKLSVQAAHRFGGVDVIDPTKWICWHDQCPMVIGSTIVYRDTGHLTEPFAAGLARVLGRSLGVWGGDGRRGQPQ